MVKCIYAAVFKGGVVIYWEDDLAVVKETDCVILSAAFQAIFKW